MELIEIDSVSHTKMLTFSEFSSGETSPQAATILQQRLRDGFVPGVDDDGYDVVLSGEGGGMACNVGAGAFHIAKEEGLFDMADRAVAISGATPVIAAEITGQGHITQEVFEKELPDRHFIDRKRKLYGKPIVKLDILRERLESKLNINALADARMSLTWGVTRANNLEQVGLSTKSINRKNIMKWFMRAMTLPAEAGAPDVDEFGNVWVDGGVSWLQTKYLAFLEKRDLWTDPELSSPYHQDPVIPDKEIRILNVNNAPEKTWTVDKVFTGFIGRALARHGQPDNYQKFFEFANKQVQSINSGPQPIEQQVYPDANAELPDLFCTDKRILRAGRVAGQNAMLLALGYEVAGLSPRPETKKSLATIAGNKVVRTYLRFA